MELQSFIRVFEEKLTRKIHQLVCKYLNQIFKKNRRIEWKNFLGFFKDIKEKNMKRLSFIIDYKIKLLQLFTGCRKVLAKTPERLYLIKAGEES